MLRVTSTHPPHEMENLLCRAAQHHESRVLTVTHVSRLLGCDITPPEDITVFTFCHTTLYKALLAAEPRLATVLPWRVALRQEGNTTILESLGPRDVCRWLGRDDLDRLAMPLETILHEVMMEAAAPGAAATLLRRKEQPGGGATENEMNIRGSLPHRIDKHGTHVEDLAGTGKLDAPGG